MEIRFDGKRALVTGAGKGIGRRIAKELHNCGAKVVALSRTQSDLDSLKAEIPSITSICCDLADQQSVKKAIEEIGPCDLLVNNAGIFLDEPLIDTDLTDSFDKIMNVNLRAALTISQKVARDMTEKGVKGSIVNVSSVYTKIAHAGVTTYAASKGALDAAARVMAVELGPKGIRVNSVNPTVVFDTNMAVRNGLHDDPKIVKWFEEQIPLGRVTKTHDVAWAVLFLLSEKASMITGASLFVDGGLTIQ